MTTTCPDCGKEFADNGLHLCSTGLAWLGDADAIKFQTGNCTTLTHSMTERLSDGRVPETKLYIEHDFTQPSAVC